jgi:hypothetical protein
MDEGCIIQVAIPTACNNWRSIYYLIKVFKTSKALGRFAP